MLKNYLKIAWRYLRKNKIFSFVNIVGLTLGFTCSILLALYVIDELSFDRFHSNADQIYRIIEHEQEAGGQERKVATVAPRIAPEAADQLPGVKDYVRIVSLGRLTVGNDPQNRDYERIFVADSSLFRFFDFEFIHGNPQTALTGSKSVVLTASTARKYFGTIDVLGESLRTNLFDVTVSAVIEDFPTNSHIDINTIYSIPTFAGQFDWWNNWEATNWTSNAFITYLKMRQGFDRSAFEQQLTNLVRQNYGSDEEFISSFELQPLTDIHLYSAGIEGGLNNNAGNPLYIYMFSIIAVLLLTIACFNYMNLSTAAASRRTQEVGMRKTLGAQKWQLVGQFVGEALLLSVASLLLALFTIELFLPWLNTFIDKTLELPLDNIPLFTALATAVVAAGLCSALYPAFFLSKVEPATALKKEIKIGGGKFSLRKVLVVAQFAVSIVMISTTIVVYNQLQYMQEKKLGFTPDNLLVADINSGALRSQFETIKQEFSKLNQVKQVTVSSRVPGEWKDFPIVKAELEGGQKVASMIFVGTDENFLDTYNIGLQSGRFLRNDKADSTSVVLNQLAARALGLENNPIGRTIEIPSVNWSGDVGELDTPFQARIIGVVDNFHFQSFRQEMRPMILASYRNPIHSIDYFTLRIQTTDWQRTISELQAINNRFDPENPLEHTFLDNRFEQFYEADRIRGQLFMVFSCVIVLIACMGLFALASFAIENRIKEIGIRKVMGATVADVNWLLSKDFALLVSIAFVVALPVAWFAAQSWLQEFAYRISLPWWSFPAAGLMALIIALGTISYQTVKAAMMNPVKSLRSE